MSRIRPGIVALLLLGGLALTGCGEDDPDTGDDPRATTGPTVPTGPAEPPEVVAILSASAAGGQTGEPVLLDDAGVGELTAGLGRGLPGEVRDVVARTDVPAGRALVGAVVAVDCETPTSVEAEDDPDGLRLVAVMPARKTPVQCLVPVTSVGIVLVDESAAAGLG